MILNSVMSLRLNIVEQLIVLVLNILDDCLPVVEFDIMWIEVLVMFLIFIVMVKMLLPISVSFVVSIAMVDWLMNTVVGVEVTVMLNAMRIMMHTLVMSRVEGVRVRRVV